MATMDQGTTQSELYRELDKIRKNAEILDNELKLLGERLYPISRNADSSPQPAQEESLPIFSDYGQRLYEVNNILENAKDKMRLITATLLL